MEICYRRSETGLAETLYLYDPSIHSDSINVEKSSHSQEIKMLHRYRFRWVKKIIFDSQDFSKIFTSDLKIKAPRIATFRNSKISNLPQNLRRLVLSR